MRLRTTVFLAALGLTSCVSVPPPAAPKPDIAPIVAPPKPAVMAPETPPSWAPVQPPSPAPGSPPVQPPGSRLPPPASVAPAPAASKPTPPAPISQPKFVAPPTAPPPPAAASAAGPTLDLAGLEQRLRDTKAIGVFTKLSLKNQVDDLLADFRALYKKAKPPPGPAFRQRYDLLLLKVLTLLQDAD